MIFSNYFINPINISKKPESPAYLYDFFDYVPTNTFYNNDKQKPLYDAVLEAPLFYYPGYEAYTSNGKIDIKESENGLVSISVDPGFSNSIVIKKGMSLWQKIGVITSIITGVCLFVYKIRKRKGKNV